MKITKFNRKKDASAANNSTTSSFSYSSSGIVAQSQINTTLEKHTLWGQQFDGTSDVSGDITNAGNIEANGDITVNSSTDTEGKTIGGNIKADGNISGKQLDADNINGKDIIARNSITSSGNITADGNISGNQITGNQLTSNGAISAVGNISGNNISAKGDINATNANISNNITTKNLTVTGSAHFFQLVIDKIRSIGGAFIASPADGFDVDVVEKVNGGYRLYWKQNDGSKERINQWISGDQALCMNMNGAKVGTSHTIDNKYYWALVVSTNAGTNPVDKLSNGTTYIDTDHNLYNYIQISSTDCDGTVNPEVGDTIVQLGNRNDKESNPNYRGSAEYIATYNSLDSELTPPLLAQYRHIGSVSGQYYDLKYYRKSYFDAKAAKFVGSFQVNTGQSVEDYIADKIDSASSGVPYISDGSDGFVAGHWIIWDSTAKKYKDSGVAAKGQNGKDGNSYKLYPIKELANVYIDGNNSKIQRQLYYQIYKYSNNIPQIVTDGQITGIWGKSEMSFTKDSLTFKVDDVINYTKDVQFISVDLKINGNIVDRRTVPVTFRNQAVFDVTNNAISSAVQESKTYTDDSITTVNNKISKVEETANGLKTTVQNVTGKVDSLTGNYQTLSNKVTEIETTADGITTQVSKYIQPSKNYFGFCKNINWNTIGTNVIPYISKYGVEIHKNDSKIARISNLGFNGEGGNFVVSGDIYRLKSNGSININLCDVQPYKIEFSKGTNGNNLNATTTPTRFVCYFNLSGNKYTDVDTYNGFLDIEGVGDTNNCIITNLKIERGIQPTAFSIADEDRYCDYKIIKQYGDWTTLSVYKDNENKSYTITTKPTANSYIDYVYFNNINVKDKQCYTLTFETDCNTENVKISSYLYSNGGIINGSVSGNGNNGYTETKLSKGKKKYYIYWYVDSAELTSFKLIKNCIPVRMYYSKENASATIKFSNITLYEGYVSDSIIQQTYSKISQTADSITTTVVGSNVISGIGNGNYWNGYTSFDENGFTFNFNSSNYLIGPVFTDYSGTYTLSFGSWEGTIKVEIYEFTTSYKTTDNPDFSSGTLIASISTKDVDNYDATKMHHSSELDRYYFTFKESSSSTKAFRVRFSTPDSSNAIQKVQIEAGNVPHLFNDSYAYNQSQIKQTADSIEMKVNDVSLKLSDGIELNGDTKVNGSVTIQDEDTGFLLTGSSGKTQISPKSIGTYQDFYNKAENSNFLTGSALAYGDQDVSQSIGFSWNFTRSIGIIPNGKTVKFKNTTISFMKPNSGTVLSGSNISFKIDIYEGNNNIKSLSSATTNMDLSGVSYVSTGGEFKLKFAVSARFGKSYWAADNDEPFKRVASAQCNWGFTFEYPNANFQLIGYDGHGINFGNNSMVYFGPQASVLKYGDYAIKLSANGGIQRYNQYYKLGSSKKTHIHGSVSYVDSIESSYASEFVPINGYNIRKTSSYAGNVYIDQNDDVLEIRNISGTVNVFLGNPAYFTGKRVLIKKIQNGGDMDVFAGYTIDQTTYKIIRADTASTVTKFTEQQYHCRAYFSDGTKWIEEWLSW